MFTPTAPVVVVPTAPTLKLEWVDATADGKMVIKLTSDQALTGVAASDFAGTGYTVDSVAEVTGSGAKEFKATITPTASGNVTVAMVAGAANGVALPTPAVATVPASFQVIKAAASGGQIDVSGGAERLIVLGQGADTVKLTSLGTSTGTVYAGVLAGAAVGDKLDVSALIKAAGGTGYTSLAVADAADTGAGFVELKNLVLTNPTASTTTVKFDISLDAATYENNKITGMVIDLDYDTSKVVSGSVSSITVDGVADSEKTYSPIVRNIAPASGSTAAITGKIAAPVDTAAPSNAQVIDSTGKALSVTLGLSTAETSFRVGIQSKAAGGETVVSTSAGTFNVDVGIAKTARLAGTSAGVTANVLTVVEEKATVAADTSDANLPGFTSATGDNQFKVLEITKTGINAGVLKFQYDTNPAKDAVTLSQVVEVDVFSTDLASFFNSDYAKLI